MDIFLPQKDELSRIIQKEAADLLKRLRKLQVDKLGLPYHCLEYFKSSHFRRLFFSIETSAHLLHRSITLSGKHVSDIVVMDYGAGVGTLYMLAKMIGCKTVIYNDHLKDWKISAVLISEAIGVDAARARGETTNAGTEQKQYVAEKKQSLAEKEQSLAEKEQHAAVHDKANITHHDEYIVGDIKDTLEVLKAKNISCDIITSRNVIEHIYSLNDFFKTVAAYQPDAIVYSSTTANFHNPAAHIKHILWHRKWEKQFLPERAELIRKKLAVLPETEVQKLAKATRGLALQDFDKAVEAYRVNKTLPDPSLHHSNTVETGSGVWFEHLLPFKEYRELVPSQHYELRFEPGFWDTHNTSNFKNLLGKLLNPIVKSTGAGGIRLAPFIYVIALPKRIR